VIKAYVDGEIVQVRRKGCIGWNSFVCEDEGLFPNFNLKDHEFRIKPSPVIIKYRLALMVVTSTYCGEKETNHYLKLCPEHSDEYVKNLPNFVKWYTNWINAEIEL